MLLWHTLSVAFFAYLTEELVILLAASYYLVDFIVVILARLLINLSFHVLRLLILNLYLLLSGLEELLLFSVLIHLR